MEYCNKSKILKYLCKYVNKGLDKAKIIFEQTKQERDRPANTNIEEKNEIKGYLDARYICD